MMMRSCQISLPSYLYLKLCRCLLVSAVAELPLELSGDTSGSRTDCILAEEPAAEDSLVVDNLEADLDLDILAEVDLDIQSFVEDIDFEEPEVDHKAVVQIVAVEDFDRMG